MCLRKEENRADIDFLYDTVTSAFESGTYFSPNISTCFMDDRINWLEEKKEKSLADYKKCLVDICRGKLKTFFPTFESMFNNIDLNQLIETNLAKTLPKHKEFLEAFHELKKRFDSIKDFPKDQCINKYFDCNISGEVINMHQLDQVYSKYKNLREPIKEKLIEI